MCMRESLYVIKGEPECYVIKLVREGSVWTPARAAHRLAQISLECQHDDKPKFTGPLFMQVRFFFKNPARESTRIARGPHHTTSPSLLLLYKFVEEISSRIIFDRSNSVITLHISKEYDDNPRTEILLQELKK